ncbi:MAG TPA: GNAT family N-acetyltransferase [Methylomirabilota bacterium]|nr:GNAT family N-acetyltransferase [Methylomirabilota bacterium]
MGQILTECCMEIRMLSAPDTDAWLRLRVRALRDHPDAFGRAAEEADTAEEWRRRFETNENGREGFLLGAFEVGLVGAVGCQRARGQRVRHAAMLWGMYVAPEARRRGIGAALLDAAIARARAWPDLDHLTLGVMRHQTPARRLYLSRGFGTTGCHPRALRVGDAYYDEEQMLLRLG